MRIEVQILHKPEPDDLTHLREALDPGIEVSCGQEPEPLCNYEVLVAGRPERRHIEASSRLRCLAIPFAGLPKTTRELMLDFPSIAVHNLHHNAAPTAELAMALMLAAAKRIVPLDQRLRRHDWTPRYEPADAVCLEGSRVLVLGYGAVGRRVGRACRALGMEVLALRKHPQALGSDGVAEVSTLDHLPELLPRADVVVITLPLTPETEGLLGEAELALLPEGALLVNVARGAVVDEAAVYGALSSGRLGAAGLDVWYAYPTNEASRSETPPSAYPFQELNNVVLSPHRGGLVAGIERLRMTHLATLLNAAARGEVLPHRVNLELGY